MDIFFLEKGKNTEGSIFQKKIKKASPVCTSKALNFS